MQQSYEQALDAYLHPGDGTALATSTTLTKISPAPDYVLPSGLLIPGSVLRLTAAGRFSTTGTPTLLLGFYYGDVSGVALATTGALTTASGAANLTWRFEALMVVRSIGAAGTAMTIGEAGGITGATTKNLAPASAPAVATINTTIANILSVGAQWGTSSASNSITCHQFLVESVA